MGKNYANRKPKYKRPKGDLYVTPKSLVWKLLQIGELNPEIPVWECAAGNGAISSVLKGNNFSVKSTDIITGEDFLQLPDQKWEGDIFTNPPFSLWDDFVYKAKFLTDNKIIMLGRTNYFGTYQRSLMGIWDHLKTVYIFNRYVDYQTPPRDDGLFHVGVLCTGWFVWDMSYTGKPTIEIMDVQKYAALGNIDNKKCKICKTPTVKYVDSNIIMQCTTCGLEYDPNNKIIDNFDAID